MWAERTALRRIEQTPIEARAQDLLNRESRSMIFQSERLRFRRSQEGAGGCQYRLEALKLGPKLLFLQQPVPVVGPSTARRSASRWQWTWQKSTRTNRLPRSMLHREAISALVRCPLRLGFEANSADDINEIARMLIESRLPAGDAPDHTKTESTGLPRPFVTWCFCAIFQRVVR